MERLNDIVDDTDDGLDLLQKEVGVGIVSCEELVDRIVRKMFESESAAAMRERLVEDIWAVQGVLSFNRGLRVEGNRPTTTRQLQDGPLVCRRDAFLVAGRAACWLSSPGVS